MVTDEVVNKLRTLGVFPDTLEQPDSVRDNAEIFEKCTTLDEIAQEAGERSWGCGSGQFVYFHLTALLKKEPEYKAKFLEEAKQHLGGIGISPEHIEEYYLSGQQPSLLFTLRHDDLYSPDIRTPFYEKADQFALEKLREWLGIKTNIAEIAEHKIAPQIKYKTLDDFIKHQNNFFAHFMSHDNWVYRLYRSKPCFKRFQEEYPEMEQELTRAATQAKKTGQRLPYEQLWEAYKIMSKLVYVDDKHVMCDDGPDDWFLCR